MGTGNDFGGPTPQSQLLPDFLTDDQPDIGPVISVSVAPDDSVPDEVSAPSEQEPSVGGQRPGGHAPALDNARRAFTDYSRFREPRSLRRAFGHYVRDGLGGSRIGAARMARSGAAAVRVAGFLGDVQTRGIEQVLRELRLDELVGRTTREIFAGVIDAICPTVETIDDDLARGALLDTVLELNEIGVADIADLDALQMREFFQRFVCNAILRRFLADVSLRGNGRAPSDNAYATLDRDIRDFIAAAVDNRVGRQLDLGGAFDANFTGKAMETIFEAAWSVLEAMDRG